MYQCKLRRKFRLWTYLSVANVDWLKGLLVTALLLSSTLQIDRLVFVEMSKFFLNNLDTRALMTHLLLPENSRNNHMSSSSIQFEM